uniref:Regulatory protein zeste n=1 Tax=Cacopsylla melanoneura TaxID=428564 RepID=A0A8D8ZCF0_9HEMI
MDNKRSRGANFTPTEKRLLWEEVIKHKDVVENKQSNKVTILSKDKVWDTITKSYNSCQTSGFRGKCALKSLYDNMKRTAKKNLSQDRTNARQTGGGSYEPSVMTPIDNMVIEEIRDQVTPLPNPYDGASAIFNDSCV